MTDLHDESSSVTPPRRRSALSRQDRVLATETGEFSGITPQPVTTMMTAENIRKEQLAAKRPRKRKIYFVIMGVVGEILITFGLVVAGFIVWQLWWTSVVANQVQSELLDDFAAHAVTSPEQTGTQHKTDPPPFTGHPQHGEVFGVLYLPSFGKDATRTITEGTTAWDVLDKGGFGHYESTAWPGEIGNFSVAAHRRGHGDPLVFVEEFKPGDPIIVETPDAYYVYHMTDHELVMPHDTRVIAPDPYAAREAEENGTQVTTAPTKRYITLTTCHPEYGTTYRWIVHGEFDYWMSRSEGMPKELIDMNKGGK